MTPHILCSVPSAIFSVVPVAFDSAGKLRRRASFLISDLRFCNVYNIGAVVARKLYLCKRGIIFYGFVRRGAAVGQSVCRNSHAEKHGSYKSKCK